MAHSIIEAHSLIQDYVRGELRRHTSREALLALASIEGVLMEVAAAMHDGAPAGDPARILQSQNDASMVADVGLAIRAVRRQTLGKGES